MTSLQGCNQQPNRPDVRLGLFGAISRSKPPVVQWYNGEWRVWTAYNDKLTLGTYILLQDEGKLQRVTIKPDGTETVTRL